MSIKQIFNNLYHSLYLYTFVFVLATWDWSNLRFLLFGETVSQSFWLNKNIKSVNYDKI